MDAFCDPRYDVYVEGIRYDLRPFYPGMLKATSQIQWFQDQIITFNGKSHPIFAEVRTERGMGFSFNLMDAEELLDFERYEGIIYFINFNLFFLLQHRLSFSIHQSEQKFNSKS